MDSFMRRLGATLIDNGYRILPLVPGAKKPGRYASGEWHNYADWARHCERQTSDIECDIWGRWPDAGIGIACGTVTLLDIDVRDAALVAQLKALAFRICGETPLQRVGLAPKLGLVYRTEAPLHGIKQHPVEVLGLGNQFVAYGIHPVTGRPYEWLDESPHSLHVDDLPLVTEAQLREFLAAAAKLIPPEMQAAPLVRSIEGERGSSDQRGTIAAISEALGFIPNDDLQWDDWFRVAMAMKGALGEDGWPLFEGWSARSGKHDPAASWKLWRGLKPRAVGAGTIYWLAEENGWTPSAELVLNGFVEEALRGVTIDLPDDERDLDDDDVDISALVDEEGEEEGEEEVAEVGEVAAVKRGQTPSEVVTDLCQVDGFLGEFVDWCEAHARRSQPWLALAAGIALVGALAGRRYRSPSGDRTNIYIIGVADSGSGKDNARSRIVDLLFDAGLEHYLGGDKLASGQAIFSALSKHPVKLFQIDEFGQLLKSLLGRNAASHQREIVDAFTEVFSRAGSRYVGKDYADQTARPREPIMQPCVILHGTTVPGPYWHAMQSGALLDGSVARMLVFQTPNDYPDERSVLDPPPTPRSLIEQAQAISRGPTHHDYGASAGTMTSSIDIEPYRVPYGPGVVEALQAAADERTVLLRSTESSTHRAHWSRLGELTSRVALIRAISRDAEFPIITLADYEWAAKLVKFCIEQSVNDADTHVSDNEVEARHKRALALIRDAGAVGIRRREFYAKTHWLGDTRQREAVLSALREAGQIKIEAQKTRTKPSIWIFAT